jgi:hypothetical protein
MFGEEIDVKNASSFILSFQIGFGNFSSTQHITLDWRVSNPGRSLFSTVHVAFFSIYSPKEAFIQVLEEFNSKFRPLQMFIVSLNNKENFSFSSIFTIAVHGLNNNMVFESDRYI